MKIGLLVRYLKWSDKELTHISLWHLSHSLFNPAKCLETSCHEVAVTDKLQFPLVFRRSILRCVSGESSRIFIQLNICMHPI
jgi:hypothetical protein